MPGFDFAGYIERMTPPGPQRLFNETKFRYDICVSGLKWGMGRVCGARWGAGEPNMPNRFTDYILQLGADPKAVEELRKDPAKAMKKAGLSADEQAVLIKGDPAAIRATIAKELGVDSCLIAAFCLVIVPYAHVNVNIGVKKK
jgi:hypothetical protein